MKKILIEILIPFVPKEVLSRLRPSSSMKNLYSQICYYMRKNNKIFKKREILLRLVDYRIFITWGYSSLDCLRDLSNSDLLDLLENPSYFKLNSLKLNFILNVPGLKILENYELPDNMLIIFPDLLENLDQRIQKLVQEDKNKTGTKLRISTGNIVNGGKSIGAILEESIKMTKTSTQKKLLKLIFARFIQTQLYHHLLNCYIEDLIIDQIQIPEVYQISEIDNWKIISINTKYFNNKVDNNKVDNNEIDNNKVDNNNEIRYKLIYPEYFGLSDNFKSLIYKIGLMIQGNIILNYISWRLLKIDRFESDFRQSILSNLSLDLINKLFLCEDLLQVLSISILKTDSIVYEELKNKIYDILRKRFFLQISNSLKKDKCPQEIDILDKYFQVDLNYANCLLIRSLRKNTHQKNENLFSMSRFREGLALRLVSYPEIKQNLIH